MIIGPLLERRLPLIELLPSKHYKFVDYAAFLGIILSICS